MNRIQTPLFSFVTAILDMHLRMYIDCIFSSSAVLKKIKISWSDQILL